MDMAEKLRVFLMYNVPREVYNPLVEVLASHDELPDDLLPIYVGGSSIDEANDIPEGAEFPQAPPPSLEESHAFSIPPASTEFTVSQGSTDPSSIPENENDPPVTLINCYRFNYLLAIYLGACFVCPRYLHRMRRKRRANCRRTTRR
jgi:hypothetical protein